MSITLEQVRQHPAVRAYIQKSDESLMAMGYTEHSFAHVTRVARNGAIYTRDGRVNITNARFRKIQCAAIARMAHDGMARAISPVHTPVDGDTVFVLSVGDRVSNVFQTGVAAADVVAASIRRGVRMAETLDGVKALRDLERPLDY